MNKKQKHELVTLSNEKGYNRFHPNWGANIKIDKRTWWLEMCLLQEWIRNKHFLHPYIVPFGDCKTWSLSGIGYTNRQDEYRFVYDVRRRYENVKFKTYEEALYWGIKEMLLKLKAVTPISERSGKK